MSRRVLWTWARVLAAAGLLALVAWRLGAGPFLDGLRAVDAPALAAAVALAVPATLCCAWRWRMVARGMGVDLPFREAVAAYFRSVFLNVALPGGVVGDVHRGVRHGRTSGDLGRGVRSVVWERTAGQAVQFALTAVVLLALPSPVRSAMPALLAVLAAVVVVWVLAARGTAGRGRGSLPGRIRAAVAADVRGALLAREAWPGIVLASVAVVACHAATFVIAARTAGVTAPLRELVPLALLVMAAMVLPNVGGWGPREGVAAWAFAAAGLGAGAGVATAVAFGVMAVAGSLPGAGVILAGWLRRAAPGAPEARAVPLGTADGVPDA